MFFWPEQQRSLFGGPSWLNTVIKTPAGVSLRQAPVGIAAAVAQQSLGQPWGPSS